jgi:epoxyqueuosine reductase
VIKGKLRQLTGFIQDEIGEVNGRAFVDSAPVMDKAWAVRSGLGWMGKHTNIIRPKEGSFFFIGELILDIELEPDTPMQDHCGTCTRCIDACPTGAIIRPYVVDGSKCISYFTIELKDAIPVEMKGQFENWAFGCDICQDVCPWNRFSKPHTEPAFAPHTDMLGMTAKDWDEITEEVFMRVFQKSAVKRAKYAGLKRNLGFLREE